jgi:serine/threonine-protein kinase HipA
VRDGRREYSVFSYDPEWLERREAFQISPDLPLQIGHVTRRAPTDADSPFPFGIADTEPDAWGKRVINRAHAKRRRNDPGLKTLTPFDYLAAVDDFSRVGALRLRDEAGQFLGSGDRFRTPPLIELDKVYESTRAVERGTETEADLVYLQGKATSLGGLRPKSTVVDEDGQLAIGKFPSIGDTRSIVRGEVLALKLMERAKLVPASARVVNMDDTPVAVITRFDRTPDGARIHYLSAGSLLLARRDEDRTYAEVVDVLRRISAEPTADVRLLWRRLVFNHLITNTDDHLWNLGVLYAGGGRWRLAPAFDVNPFPDRRRESKTWLSENAGPITSLDQLIKGAGYFGIDQGEAERLSGEIAHAIAGWRDLATSRHVGLNERELADFELAFEHSDAEKGRALAR